MCDIKITEQTIQEIKRYDLVRYMQGLGFELKHKGQDSYYVKCPNHNDSVASAILSYNKKGTHQIIHCYKCQSDFSIIDVCMNENGLTFLEACKKLLQDEGITTVREMSDQEKKEAEAREHAKKMKSLKGTRYNAKTLDDEARAYLERRGILNVVNHINNRNDIPVRVARYTYNGANQLIYDYQDKPMLIRKKFRDVDMIDSFGRKLKNKATNVGYSVPSKVIFDGKCNKYVIVEGFEDGMSIIAMKKYNVIILNGVSNKLQLIQMLSSPKVKQWAQDKEFIIATDRDEAGIECLEYLRSNIEQLGLKCTIPQALINLMDEKGFNDINEYYVNEVYNKKRGNR